MRDIKLLGALALLVLAALVAGCVATPRPAARPAPPELDLGGVTAVVLRSPTCSCCHEHEAYLRDGGLKVEAVVDPDIMRVKQAYGVPTEMYSCHTTDVAGYFVEGHVPLAAIEKLLAERPDLDGIALPGMPPGSPGMGGVQEGPLTVFGVKDGQVVGVFGEY